MDSKNLILSIPPEIRNAIYKLAVVTYYRKTLALPALAQVNKQLRREVVPIYYGKNHFLLELPTVDAWMDEWSDEDQPGCYNIYESFRLLCGSLAEYMQFVTSLKVTFDYDPSFFYNGAWGIGFQLKSKACPMERRIGNAETDWNNTAEADKAFRHALALYSAEHTTRIHGDVDQYINMDVLIDTLCFFAKHCVAADNVRLVYYNNGWCP
ncbi:hypothetical protein HD806DRAFT_368360 [Xylariaceae sp. AK1471]|nr:hypothetical protein HD806DRAFT_368360 [Xylariaceae sp. AK1471]